MINICVKLHKITHYAVNSQLINKISKSVTFIFAPYHDPQSVRVAWNSCLHLSLLVLAGGEFSTIIICPWGRSNSLYTYQGSILPPSILKTLT